MGIKIKIALLLCLVTAAILTGYGAYKSIRAGAQQAFPEEVYAQFKGSEKSARFYLRTWEGYVAVYSGYRERSPLSVTDIEVAELRGTDKALLAGGIPVADDMALLHLLEDLGS